MNSYTKTGLVIMALSASFRIGHYHGKYIQRLESKEAISELDVNRDGLLDLFDRRKNLIYLRADDSYLSKGLYERALSSAPCEK